MSSPYKKVAFYTLGCKLNFSETSTIARDFMSAGYYAFTWDATNDSNEVVNDGYYRIIASNGIVENYVHVKKESID